MLPKSWRKNELGLWVVFDELGRSEALDRSRVRIVTTLTATCSIGVAVLLHAAPAATVRAGLATSL